mmetsp:Transcript_70710/g.207064  ORF Transcript_70710/g.207064 Transcript_70710/m.207064 type:complete len:278 (+) Transcript_70710:1483-2316(+)
MGLRGVHVLRRYAGVPDAVRNDLQLRHAVRRAQARSPAVGVDADPCEDAHHGVLVVPDALAVDDVRQRLQRQGRDTLPPHEAAGGGVERQAPAPPRQPAHAAVLRPPGRRHHELRAHAQAEVGDDAPALPLHGLGGHEDGGHAGGLVRVHGHAGPLHAQDEGEPVRGDAARAARGAVHALARLLREAVLAEGVAHVDAARGVHEAPLVHAHERQRVVAHLQDVPLVRIHALSLCYREAEELRIEQLNSVNVHAMLAVSLAEPPRLRVLVVVRRVVPP